MARISKTTFCSKDKNLVYKFWERYKDVQNTTREISLNPDSNGLYTTVIYYHPNEPLTINAA